MIIPSSLSERSRPIRYPKFNQGQVRHISVAWSTVYPIQPPRERYIKYREQQRVQSLETEYSNFYIYTKDTMLPRPLIVRASQFARRHMQAPVYRDALQRRFASTGPPKLEGPMDNAFNRERAAVKAHAAQSAGTIGYTPNTKGYETLI